MACSRDQIEFPVRKVGDKPPEVVNRGELVLIARDDGGRDPNLVRKINATQASRKQQLITDSSRIGHERALCTGSLDNASGSSNTVSGEAAFVAISIDLERITLSDIQRGDATSALPPSIVATLNNFALVRLASEFREPVGGETNSNPSI
jgi:hypothetical protein